MPGRKWRLRYFLLGFLALILGYYAIDYYWREKRWRWIIVHHTAADRGNMEYYRELHQKERGWPDIAYHILINNGSYNTMPGQIEVSQAWLERSHHYSTKRTMFNYFGIAVALVGNFSRYPIPGLQKEALVELLARLATDHGVAVENIVGHGEVWTTECPGNRVDMQEIRSLVRERLAQGRSL